MLWFDVQRGQLRLTAGAAYNANTSWTERSSLLLRLGASDGPVGLGEATPLPHYSPDDIDSAERELRALSVESLEPVRECTTAAEVLQALAPVSATLCPSARFALECAALDFASQLHGATMHDWILALFAVSHTAPRPELRCCRHVDLRVPDPWRDAEPGAYKAKVGLDLSVEVAAARARPACVTSLRLDANGSFAGEELDAKLRRFSDCDAEFVEEPAPLFELGAVRDLPLPIAFDESLFGLFDSAERRHSVEDWCRSGQVAAFIVKPMALGGLSAVRELWQLSALWRVPLILSHIHDGALAASVYRQLALAIGSRQHAMGLFPHPALELWGDVREGAG